MARLPWKEQQLPSNLNISKKRTNSLVWRLSDTSFTINLWCHHCWPSTMWIHWESADTQYIHQCPLHPLSCNEKDSVTTPIHIVFDCSCRDSQSSTSLNDCLLSSNFVCTITTLPQTLRKPFSKSDCIQMIEIMQGFSGCLTLEVILLHADFKQSYLEPIHSECSPTSSLTAISDTCG